MGSIIVRTIENRGGVGHRGVTFAGLSRGARRRASVHYPRVGTRAMKRASRCAAVLALLVAACQPQSRRLLLLDLALSDPIVLDATAAPWHAVGYTVEYRRFYPHLTRQDLDRYRALMLLGARALHAPYDLLRHADVLAATGYTH